MNYSHPPPFNVDRDPLFDDAARLIIENDNASASFLQRKMSLGYARAARILDELYMAGVIGPADGAKPREVYFKTFEDLKLKLPQLIQSINFEKLKEKEGPFPPITQYTLYLTVIATVIGLFRVTDPNIKILYSLCMIIGASIGRTGSDVSYNEYVAKYNKAVPNMWLRSISFHILWIFGVLGLLI